jgi:hypothetical protein
LHAAGRTSDFAAIRRFCITAENIHSLALVGLQMGMAKKGELHEANPFAVCKDSIAGRRRFVRRTDKRE